MVNKPVIRPAISGGKRSLGEGPARIPMILRVRGSGRRSGRYHCQAREPSIIGLLGGGVPRGRGFPNVS